MKILRTVQSTQKLSSLLRSKNKIIGFVPTMGYLHGGHLSLMKLARKKCDELFVSIFVNPIQFGANEDLSRYPRDFKSDEKLCKRVGVDYIFYPNSTEIYPENFSTYLDVENITDELEGKIRPGHFRGVATVVLKLFNIVQPHFSVFGQKDAQQAAVIKKMVRDLNLNTKILIGKTIREKDGLAMSSRNVYMNSGQRKDASVLSQALRFAKSEIEKRKNVDLKELKNKLKAIIASKGTVIKIDYISFNNFETLEPLKRLEKKSKVLISLAVRFNKVRLIDNTVAII